MITLEKIDIAIINIGDGDSIADNVVAVAVKIDDHGVAVHSGLLVGVDNEYYLFHYTSKEVLLENPVPKDEWYFCKELEIIDGEEYSLNFLAHCQTILQEEAPNYGFWFDGSYYDGNGRYFTNGKAKNYTTCVGFCIKVISGFIQNHDEYFVLSDWDVSTMSNMLENNQEYFHKFFLRFSENNPGITADDFKQSFKRITPLEYTGSAFLKKMPVRKADLEGITESVGSILVQKRLSSR